MRMCRKFNIYAGIILMLLRLCFPRYTEGAYKEKNLVSFDAYLFVLFSLQKYTLIILRFFFFKLQTVFFVIVKTARIHYLSDSELMFH